mgnify:CR=1 FL=1
MRLVQILIPEGRRAAALAVLDAEAVDYVVFDETSRSDFEALVQFPVPESGLDPVLDRLSEVGIREDAYTIVLAPETVVSRRLETLQQKYPGLRISRDELIARAADLAPANSTFFIFIGLSTVIATTGLLLDSAATIIGAMVVAPLMGPAISASVGAVVGDAQLAYRGTLLQLTGLLAAIGTAALLGVVLRHSILVAPGLDIREVPQIAERLNPGLLSLVLALGSGVAGALSIVRNVSSALVGVAIAVALIPPAAVSGIGLAWADLAATVASGILVLVNLVAVNLAGLIVLWLAGYRAPYETGVSRARRTVRMRIGFNALAIAILSVELGVATIATYQANQFASQITRELQVAFPSDAPNTLEFVEATVDYDAMDVLLGHRAHIRVVFGRPAAVRLPPDLAQRLARHIEQETGRDVHLQLGFVQSQVAD